MSSVVRYQEAPDMQGSSTEDIKESQEVTTVTPDEIKASVTGTVHEALVISDKTRQFFEKNGWIGGSSDKKSGDADIDKDVTEMISAYLGQDVELSVDTITDAQTKLLGEGYKVTVDGAFGNTSYNEILKALKKQEGTSNPQLSQNIDSAVSQIESARETEASALKALEAVKSDKNAVKAIQEALSKVGAYTKKIDGISGTGTQSAVKSNPSVALEALAAYIDSVDNANVEKRLQTEKPKNAAEIDAALGKLNNESTDEQLIAVAHEFTRKELGADVRNKASQYISLKLQAMGKENEPWAQRLVEKVLAQGAGNYEQKTTELQIRRALRDGSGRFAKGIGSFDENFNGSYFKIQQTLQSKSGRSRVENGMESGMSGTAKDILFTLFGVDGEAVASRVHAVTGRGKDGDADMSIELANGIQLSNAYYDEASGAIYAVVAKGNGCEGNLVVIPVETFVKPKPKYVPKPKGRQKPKVAEPTNLLKEIEEPVEEDCNTGTRDIWDVGKGKWVSRDGGCHEGNGGDGGNGGGDGGNGGGDNDPTGSDANGDAGKGEASADGNGANGDANSDSNEE